MKFPYAPSAGKALLLPDPLLKRPREDGAACFEKRRLPAPENPWAGIPNTDGKGIT